MRSLNHNTSFKLLLAATGFYIEWSTAERGGITFGLTRHVFVDGLTQLGRFSIPLKMSNGKRYQNRQSLHRRSSFCRALEIRGGKDDLNLDDLPNDQDIYVDSHSVIEEVGEIQELRKRWSCVPIVPTIEWPIDTNNDLPGNEHERHHRPIKAIIIMDGFSPYHGQYLSQAAHHIYGAAVIQVLSDFMTRYLYQVEKQTDHLSSRLPDLDNPTDVEAWKSHIPSSIDICGIYCESDSGLDDAEKLGVALGLYPRCHDGINQGRRNKFLMNQMVHDVGKLDVVKQKSCKSLREAEDFAKSLGLIEDANSSSPLVVVKPIRGVASDDVHLCSNLSSLRTAFTKIYRSPIFGSSTSSKHDQVLVQEFASGTECAVDVVCRDGERKVAALWRYDKRAVNGAPFVYFGSELVNAIGDDGSAEGKEAEQAVCNYVFKALDALGVRWGLSHVECIVDKILPSSDTNTQDVRSQYRVRLVEVNCRQHNTDFRPLTNAIIGYNALDMVLAAYLDGNTNSSDRDDRLVDAENSSHHRYPIEMEHLRLKWDTIPTFPTTLAHGAIVHFVSFVEGTICKVCYEVVKDMQELESVMDMQVYPQFLDVGNEIKKTVDIRSDTGWAHLMNDNEDQFRSDYQRLVDMMKEMFEVD